jgi:hypothetical protein
MSRNLFTNPHPVLLGSFTYVSHDKTANLLQSVAEKPEAIAPSFTIAVALLQTTGYILTTLGGGGGDKAISISLRKQRSLCKP